jgi:hypothetical protein
MRGAYAKGGQLSRNERGIRIINGWEDRYIKKLKERLILLTMNNLHVAVRDPHLLL